MQQITIFEALEAIAQAPQVEEPPPVQECSGWISVTDLIAPPAEFQVGDRVACTVRCRGKAGVVVAIGHPILGERVALVQFWEGADPYPCRFENLLHAGEGE